MKLIKSLSYLGFCGLTSIFVGCGGVSEEEGTDDVTSVSSVTSSTSSVNSTPTVDGSNSSSNNADISPTAIGGWRDLLGRDRSGLSGLREGGSGLDGLSDLGNFGDLSRFGDLSDRFGLDSFGGLGGLGDLGSSGGFDGFGGLDGLGDFGGFDGLSGFGDFSGFRNSGGGSGFSGLDGLSGLSGQSGGSASNSPAAAFGQTGAYQVTSSGSGACTFFYPTNSDSLSPVILWGNGTGTSPSTYSGLLRHWASWGYIIAAANTPNAGSGTQMLDCYETLRGNTIGNQSDFSYVGASGHSQGAIGAVVVGADERVSTTAPIMPFISSFGSRSGGASSQTGPMLLLSGSADTITPPATAQAPAYNAANVPVFWATLQGASHLEPSLNGGRFRDLTTAWFEYQLKGNTEAAALFEGPSCGFCAVSGWTIQKKGL